MAKKNSERELRETARRWARLSPADLTREVEKDFARTRAEIEEIARKAIAKVWAQKKQRGKRPASGAKPLKIPRWKWPEPQMPPRMQSFFRWLGADVPVAQTAAKRRRAKSKAKSARPTRRRPR